MSCSFNERFKHKIGVETTQIAASIEAAVTTAVGVGAAAVTATPPPTTARKKDFFLCFQFIFI